MHRPSRSSLLLVLVLASAAACSTSDMTVRPRMAPVSPTPTLGRIRATDSTLTLTDVVYGDTSVVLRRLSPLPADISVSALIGPAGGSLAIPDAGVRLELPAGAVAVPTVITMTAFKGVNVAYDFGPHGTSFAAPVKIQQDLRLTLASGNATLLNGMHAGYYSTSLDSSFVDPLHLLAQVTETELGYMELNKTQLKFYVGHFSGYLVSCGRF